MADFINLSCPSCGASLQVDKALLRAKCPYCGKESIIKPTEAMLESQSQCPICHRNDRTKKVSAIMSTAGENRAYFAIPPKPDQPGGMTEAPQPEYPVQGMVKSTRTLLLAFIGAWALAFISLICAISSSDSRSAGIVFLILFGIAGFVLFRQYNKANRQNVNEEDDYQQRINNYHERVKSHQEKQAEQQALYQKWLVNWQAAVEKWKSLYYCERDDCVFVPGNAVTAALKDIEKFCYQKD